MACLSRSFARSTKSRSHTLVELYNDLVERGRSRKLPKEAMGGGIATVTNFGTFGIIWATPIPLPEQNLVLGLGAGRETPVWSDEEKTFVLQIEAATHPQLRPPLPRWRRRRPPAPSRRGSHAGTGEAVNTEFLD